ncbi:MAG: alpha-galactosidase [Bacteroidales bacterium]|nr:alpha-galactosidase [Bacteroidales bacterium]
MKRRNFLQLSSFSALGAGLSLPFSLADDLFAPFQGDARQMVPASWRILDNGAFDIVVGDLSVTGCYPAIGEKPLQPLQVRVKRTSSGGLVEYLLGTAKISIILDSDEDSLTLACRLSGINKAPDWIYPLAGGQVRGARKWYKQGMGFAGPSGIFPIPEPEQKMEQAVLKEDVWSYDSYLATALFSDKNNTLLIGVYRHDNYMHRSTLYNRQHRFGLIDRQLDSQEVFIESGFGTEQIPFAGELELPVIHIMAGPSPYALFQRYAKHLAAEMKARTSKPSRYYFCSWYEFEREYSLSHLKDLINGLKGITPPISLQAVQIDDGYCVQGDWLEANDKWPGGMETAFRLINDAGMEAGIWVAPFMVHSGSKLFAEHPEWLLRDNNGNIVTEWNFHNGSMHVLDSSHPEAFEYLRKVFRTFRQWGATVFKTDFMDWGLRDSLKVKRFTPGKTSVQYFTEVIRMIREEIGEESYWLGCISPFQPMIGYVDGMRLANDVGVSWNDESIGNIFRETYAGHWFNNILWQNDPDVLYLRDSDITLTAEEKESIALWNGILGGTITTSDRFHKLSPEKLKLWRFLQPPREHFTAFLPFWTEKKDLLVAVRHYPHTEAWGVLFVNITKERLSEKIPVRSLTGVSETYVYQWMPGNSVPFGLLEEISISLRPHESRLFYLSQRKSPPPRNMTIGGIMTEGM